MPNKLLCSSILTFLILEINTPLESQLARNITQNSLIYKFCVATLKSKKELKMKINFNEISKFTCECFLKKYKYGNSFKNSRIYCKNKASEKYNL